MNSQIFWRKRNVWYCIKKSKLSTHLVVVLLRNKEHHRRLSFSISIGVDFFKYWLLLVSLLFFSWSVLFSPRLSSFLLVSRKCYIFLDFGLFFSRNFLLAPDFGLWFPFYVPIWNRLERQNLSVPNYNSADFFDGARRRCPEAMQSVKPAKRLVLKGDGKKLGASPDPA